MVEEKKNETEIYGMRVVFARRRRRQHLFAVCRLSLYFASCEHTECWKLGNTFFFFHFHFAIPSSYNMSIVRHGHPIARREHKAETTTMVATM